MARTTKTAPKPRATAKTTTRSAATTTHAATPTDTAQDDALRKKDLIERVTEASGVKRKDAKAAMEATLAELGRAIAAGEELNLQGLGKLKVNRVQEQSNGTIYICKLRQPKPGANAEAGKAEATLAEAEN